MASIELNDQDESLPDNVFKGPVIALILITTITYPKLNNPE